MDNYFDHSIIEMFFFETEQLIEQMDRAILLGEQSTEYSPELVNEILRAMHTIKGSAATMKYENIAEVAHVLEDVFHYLREHKPPHIDYSELTDLVLEGSDYIKIELHKIKNGDSNDGNGDSNDGDSQTIVARVQSFLHSLQHIQHPGDSEAMHYYYAHLFFEEAPGMENVRAYTVVHHLQEFVQECRHVPVDLIENEHASALIQNEGFQIWFRTSEVEEVVQQHFSRLANLKSLQLIQLDADHWNAETGSVSKQELARTVNEPILDDNSQQQGAKQLVQQSMISVNVAKLDKLMDLVGELVITEAMVTQNPELNHLQLESFTASARHLQKITGEIQDMVMSIRMVPLTATFQRMHRIVRDMSKKLNKDVQLKLLGEETEVDKNIIEHISDPLMHVIRNAIDHGIEHPSTRIANGKRETGTITLEARNAGSDVLIMIRDDGGGLDKEQILSRAKRNGMMTKPEAEMTDKEIYALIFSPGFSTKENVSEFSGRGVGMDVVMRNIEAIGGKVWIESERGQGSIVSFKIPLTLAIIEGMNIQVGNTRLTIPMTAIKESFRAEKRQIITSPDGGEMIMVRGQCYPLVKLWEFYRIEGAVTELSSGIIIMIENDIGTLCLFADELIGQQQVVVKMLPEYIRKIKKVRGLAGCTLLGDGRISLIMDMNDLV